MQKDVALYYNAKMFLEKYPQTYFISKSIN
jgi:hypothetical protein